MIRYEWQFLTCFKLFMVEVEYVVESTKGGSVLISINIRSQNMKVLGAEVRFGQDVRAVKPSIKICR